MLMLNWKDRLTTVHRCFCLVRLCILIQYMYYSWTNSFYSDWQKPFTAFSRRKLVFWICCATFKVAVLISTPNEVFSSTSDHHSAHRSVCKISCEPERTVSAGGSSPQRGYLWIWREYGTLISPFWPWPFTIATFLILASRAAFEELLS